MPSPNGVPGDINQLDGVTQTSAGNAWAVGAVSQNPQFYTSEKTLVLHCR